MPSSVLTASCNLYDALLSSNGSWYDYFRCADVFHRPLPSIRVPCTVTRAFASFCSFSLFTLPFAPVRQFSLCDSLRSTLKRCSWVVERPIVSLEPARCAGSVFGANAEVINEGITIVEDGGG